MKLAHCTLSSRSGHDAGRNLLRQLYMEETGEDLPPICTTATGKPYFENSPYCFSITHTDRHAFCALAKAPIGIDAEELDRRVSPRVVPRILSPFEMEQYNAAADKQRALLTFWVLKEAEAKFTGQGLVGFPNRTAFRLDDPRVTEVDGCLLAIITEEDQYAV